MFQTLCPKCECALLIWRGYVATANPHVPLEETYVVKAVFSHPGIGALSYESARYQMITNSIDAKLGGCQESWLFSVISVRLLMKTDRSPYEG